MSALAGFSIPVCPSGGGTVLFCTGRRVHFDVAEQRCPDTEKLPPPGYTLSAGLLYDILIVSLGFQSHFAFGFELA